MLIVPGSESTLCPGKGSAVRTTQCAVQVSYLVLCFLGLLHRDPELL